jgi:hypothetical protein
LQLFFGEEKTPLEKAAFKKTQIESVRVVLQVERHLLSEKAVIDKQYNPFEI